MPELSSIPMALLAHVRELVTGRERGSEGESGWTKGAYIEKGGGIRNCLNGALRVAERDVMQMSLFDNDEGAYSAPMATEEGKSAQRLLAEACAELQPDHVSIGENTPSGWHQAIVSYNDLDSTSQDHMDAALELAEKKAWSEWLDSHPYTLNLARDDFGEAVFISDLLDATPLTRK